MLFSIRNLEKRRQREQGYRLLVRRLLVPEGACIAITGSSGCGKSTTLDILGLALRPDSADEFTFASTTDSRGNPSPAVNVAALWQKGRADTLTRLRLAHMGYVLQTGELLPFLSVAENMLLTARMAGFPDAAARTTMKHLTERLAIAHLLKSMPNTLSVGERQRVAIVRALTPRPRLILADEPTASLDPRNAVIVREAFLECVREQGSTLVLVTHNTAWASEGGLTNVPFTLECQKEGRSGVTAILDYDGGAGTSYGKAPVGNATAPAGEHGREGHGE